MPLHTLVKRWRSPLERGIQGLLLVAACSAILIVGFILLYLAKESYPLLAEVSLGDLLGDRWLPASDPPRFGMLPLLTGSVLVTLLATLLAVPFGVCGAVYVAEFASDRERALLKPFVEVLAGIPSVVLGFFGLMVVGQVVKQVFGLTQGLTALTGAILLAFMAIPTILSVSEDAIRAVPKSYREAALAMGASRWQTTWRVIVPAASSGVLAAVMLGVGRVVGETMAVLMVTGNAAQITLSPFESVRTMTATIAAEMGEVAHGSDHYHALFLVGLLLLLMTLGINLTARRFVRGRVAGKTASRLGGRA